MALYVCLFFHCKSLYLHNNYYWDAIFFILRVEVIKVILILIFFPSFVTAKYFVHYPFIIFVKIQFLRQQSLIFCFCIFHSPHITWKVIQDTQFSKHSLVCMS